MSGLPAGWSEASLAELGDEVRGSVAPSPVETYELYSVPTFRTRRPEILQGSEIGSAKRPVRPGDVLLCKINPRINRVWMVAEPLAHAGEQIASTEYLVFRTGSSDLSRYIMWYLQSPAFREWIKLSVEGATGSHTRAKSGPILRQRVPVPPLNEQRRIVGAIEEQFSRLDAAEGLLGRVRASLQSLQSAMFRAAFDGSWPTVRIEDVAHVGSGATPKRDKTEYWVDGTIPWVTSGQLTKPFVNEPTALITEHALEETNVKLWPKHTLLVALYGEGRTRGHCSELLLEATTNQACAAIVLRAESVNRAYLKLFFAASYDANRRLASGGVQPNLSLGLIKGLRFPLPPLGEQRRIVDQTAQQHSLVESLHATLERASRRSSSVRRSILERAFRGELVPQDPDDEPAFALLERIAAERAAAETANGRRPRRRATMETS